MTRSLTYFTAATAVTLGLGFASVAPAAAQDNIAPDRPGLDFSPAVLEPGVVQLEIGPVFLFEDDADTDIASPSLLRVGLAPSIELRAGVSPYNRTSVGPVTESGFGDVEFGAKLQLSDGTSGGPALAVIPSVTLPSGDEAFTSDGVGYLLNAVAGFSVAENTGLAVVGGLYYTKAGDGHDASGMAALVLGRSLSDRVSGFVEWGVFPTEGPDDPMLVGGGLTLLVTSDLQLDVYVDRGLTDSATDWQLGTGASVRF